ncbi:protein DEK-like [Haliotis rubra]|uniref:protein DEK-like n=1 Tax=Haliotis rubra TaxID=36100 RepID=UPI001EE577DB|nr:protein DEK-like [Haliotis rubra]
MSDTEKTDVAPQKEEEDVEEDADESKDDEEMKELEDSEKETEKADTKVEEEVEMEDEPESKPEPVEASPKKSPKKRKKVEKEEEDDEEEEELPLGLLERPVVIESGKREKKKVERLAMTMTFAPQHRKKVDVPEGSGAKLGECPRIEYKIAHLKADDLKPLHRIVFGKKGTSQEVKKNLRQFCGFSFSKEDKEYDKRVSIIGKLTLPVLKTICEVLDLERSGVKDDVVQRVMDFLMNPSDSGRKVPEPKKRGRASKERRDKGVKRKRAEKKEGKKKKKKTSKEDVESENDEDEDEDDEEPEENDKDEDDDADEDGDAEEEEESEEEVPKKKKAKLETPRKPKEEKREKKENDKKEKKEKAAKKAEKKESKKKKVEEESDEDDSEDETLGSKKTGPPNNDELRDVVKKILDGANLEEVTMKTVVKQVYAKYPDFDLSDKKEFIKNTVKQLIS